MSDSTRLFPRRLSFSALLAALSTVLSPAPAAPQYQPWIGLTDQGSDSILEGGSGQDGPADGDLFGFSFAAGDFNADGVDDLAIGVPTNDCSAAIFDCGSVQVRYGRRGLGIAESATGLHQGTLDVPETGEKLGYSLAAGDFDGNGVDDLAVGAPWNVRASGNSTITAGEVDLHYGTSAGIVSTGLPYRPDHLGVPGYGYNQARFGHAIAFGDFDGNGKDDLAVGAPFDYTLDADGNSGRGGTVTVFGLDSANEIAGFEIFQGDQGLSDTPETDDRFGAAVAVGNFNADGYDDLAIGVPGEDGSGAVLVLYGSPWSLIYPGHTYLGEWDLGEPAEDGDRFGEELAAGDFNGDGYDDLAIGTPGEDGPDGAPVDMGLVGIVYGSSSGVSTARPPVVLFEHMLFGSGSEPSDYFGAELAAGDFDHDGFDDLAIGHEGEDNGDYPDSGAVTIVTGSFAGLPGRKRELVPGYVPGGLIPALANGGPAWGAALVAGDWNGDGLPDLAIGGPGADNYGTWNDMGQAVVLYGSLFADGFEDGSIASWSNWAP